MLDRFRDFLRGVKSRMFKKDEIENGIVGKVAISDTMINRIELWLNMYQGHAPWCKGYVSSSGTEVGICREFADTALSEMYIGVSNERLNELTNKAMLDLNENLQMGLALGAFILKPLGNGNIEYVSADKFVPISFFSNGKLQKCGFISTKVISERVIYRKIEFHELTDNGLAIWHKAFCSQDKEHLGRACPLDKVPEWKSFSDKPVIYPIDKMDFGYFRVPLKNAIDGSMTGVSIYNRAVSIIEKIDNQFAALDWEFESGERAIHVDEIALKIDKTGKASASKLNERLYRGLNIEGGSSGDLFKEYSPTFREKNIINGLEEYKRELEFIVGLAYGDLSNVNTISKTAEEIKTSKTRKYNRVKAIQVSLKDFINDFVDALAFHEGLYTSGYEVTIEFKDSVLTDETKEREQDMKDVAAGLMQAWEYRMKWRCEDEKTAKEMVTQSADIME